MLFVKGSHWVPDFIFLTFGYPVYFVCTSAENTHSSRRDILNSLHSHSVLNSQRIENARAKRIHCVFLLLPGADLLVACLAEPASIDSVFSHKVGLLIVSLYDAVYCDLGCALSDCNNAADDLLLFSHDDTQMSTYYA